MVAARLRYSTLFGAIVFCLVLSLMLGELYTIASHAFSGPPWLAPLLINTLLASVVAWRIWDGKVPRPGVVKFGRRGTLATWLARPWWRAYIPALAVLVLSIVVAATSRITYSGFESRALTSSQFLFVLWVPVIEELLFRVGIGAFFRRYVGVFWGAYFSAILFAVVHTQPTLASMLNGHIGAPLGPLLLGIATEFLYIWTGRILPAMVLHAVCNLTVVIFAVIDGRWLDWLGAFYI